MTEQSLLGVVNHKTSDRKTDYLYRISIKCLVRDEVGRVLVVKEAGRDWWDLPGGGMDHGENISAAIARELKEEVNLEGDIQYQVISVDEPAYLMTHNFWQMRLIFRVIPVNMTFSVGEDGDEIAFLRPEFFRDSDSEVERRIYRYSNLI